MFKFNERIEIHYPNTTLVNKQPTFRLRRIAVRGIRDLVANPLTIEDYLRRPLIRRGRWLILGRCEDTRQLRQFYLATTKEEWRELPLRIGLYEPFGSKPVQLLSRPFGATVRERILLSRALQMWSRQNFDGLQLRVFADDLRRV